LVGYAPDWEPLFDALHRVIRAKGFNPANWQREEPSNEAFLDDFQKAIEEFCNYPKLSSAERRRVWEKYESDPNTIESEIQKDICQAIADRRIGIRLLVEKIGSHPERVERTTRYGDDVEIPPHIHPSELSWSASCLYEDEAPWPWRAKAALDPSQWRVETIELRREDVVNVLCDGVDNAAALPKRLTRIERGIHDAARKLWRGGVPPPGLRARLNSVMSNCDNR
jgi:hypothetical protein